MKIDRSRIRVSSANLGYGLGDVIRAPNRLISVVDKIEKVPLIGSYLKDAEYLSGLSSLTEGAKTAINIEKHIKDLTGIDIVKSVDNIDNFFGYTGNIPDEKPRNQTTTFGPEKSASISGRVNFQSDFPMGLNLRGPNFMSNIGLTQPHFSVKNQTSYITGGLGNSDLAVG